MSWITFHSADEPSSARPAPTRKRRATVLLLCAMIVAPFALTWLFLRAEAVSTPNHTTYMRELRLIRQADAELDAAVLSSRFGLSRNYDGIVARMEAIDELLDRILQTPDFLLEADREVLVASIERYLRLQQTKFDLIDRFKRENAVVSSSLAFLPAALDSVHNAPGADSALFSLTGIYVRNVLTHAQTEDPALARIIEAQAESIAANAGQRAESLAEPIRILLRHGHLITTSKPELEALVRDILSLPTALEGENLSHTYAQGYANALARSRMYRILLYLVALSLVAYVAFAMIRLYRTTGALNAANLALEERIDTLRQTQADLRLYARVFTSASEGMAITDSRARILAINPAFSRITGYSQEEVAGHTPAILRSGRQDASFYRKMWAALESRGQWQGEIWNRRKDGTVFPEWLSITAVGHEDGSPDHYIAIFMDISDRKQAEATIHHLAHHDALTGLPNLVLLRDRLDQAILKARRSGRHVGVLMLDLDRFKLINDTLGHDVGDSLIVQVARRCQSVLRETDTISRQGGDEFAFVLSDLEHVQDAAHAARKLLNALEAPFVLGAHTLTVTGSIGIALYPDDGSDPSQLLGNADAAMYRAKEEGRNGYAYYSDDLNLSSLSELLLENQLRNVLDRNELRLHYQPKVDARDGSLRGLEALLRWQHPEQGLLSPGRFIPLAEDIGLIVPIGEWVLREACRQLRAWIDAGLEPVPVSVNLSAQQLAQQDIPSLVESVLTAYRLAPHLLELELTETMLMRDPQRTTGCLRRLRELGVALSIDDFGTGYSSLGYLRMFPVHTLKIDRSFVEDIRDTATGETIAIAIIALAHSLGLKVVAEGVETEVQRDQLARGGCDQLQGYLCGRPAPAGDIALRLRETARA